MSKLLLLVALGFAAWWIWRARSRPAAMSVTEARALLEVGPEADAAAVHTAYRRLTARVHPDAGGSAELARRVKTARDVLIRDPDTSNTPAH